ncbi:LuxR C-terminal-related transcriptional regulator [Streptomyces katsurahamanus]|uniref:Response regulator transcription factor n=1 Tax=Streptomyces katsurahamanus TaxID=2577098 RepID=A0ABW9NWA4_9ACTN|nr:response regulator transcription factor [Streptomyces katsurahamanus]MQS37324.1 response regulator transcription factor [Streptomyces katsurahamanus]
MEINVLVISDNPVSLAGLEAIIDQGDQFTLIEQAADGLDDLRCPKNSESTPHVIILAEPPSKRTICENVQQVVAMYRHESPAPKIIVVSQNEDDDVIVAALRIGVNGYLARISSPEELLHSIQIVAKGGAAFSPTIAARFSRYFSMIQRMPELGVFSDLTSRELEILELIAGGLGNQQIARQLFLAEKTVRNYVSRIFAKMEVHDRTTAAVLARNAGFGEQTKNPLSQSA